MIYFYLIIWFILSSLLFSWIISFLLVLQYRKWETDLNNWLTGHSYCNDCRYKLRWYNLIPIFSYIIQKWKCNYCRIKIPLKYFIYELLFWLLWWFIYIISILLLIKYIQW